jgi:vitamin B12 transporter
VGRKRFNMRLMGKALVFWALFLLLFSPAAWAQEALQLGEVVVTASKIAEPEKEATSSVVVITSEEIERANVDFVPDVLRKAVGINVVQTGGRGSQADVFLRGASPDQTLIMIDGVKVKSTTSGGYDLSGVSVGDIERVEIVKGPQSTMYGSEAMGGVINIITKKGKGKLTTDISYEHGSYNTSNPAITLSGGTDKLDYRLSASYFKTDGISAAKDGTESDGYENMSFSSKLGMKTGKNTELEFSGSYYKDQRDLDGYDYSVGSMTDDLNYVQDREHYVLSGKGIYFVADVWEQVLTVSATGDKIGADDPDTKGNNWDIVSDIKAVEWRNSYYRSDANTLTSGVEYRTEGGQYNGAYDSYDKSVENKAVYLNNKLKSGNIIIDAGLRHDDHQTFGSAITYKVGAVEEVKQANLRFRASYATGFKAPDLNDLFWPEFGNPDLKPEKSTSWEVGAEQDYTKSFSLFVTYFNQVYEDLIDWAPLPSGQWAPQNISEAEVKGVETGFEFRLTKSINLMAAYTYLDTEDKSTEERLERRPDHKASASLGYSGRKLSLVADYTYVGKRFDQGVDGDLDTYSLVKLSGSFNVTESIGIFGRVENLLDEEYEEAGGFGTPGKSFYGGIKATF